MIVKRVKSVVEVETAAVLGDVIVGSGRCDTYDCGAFGVLWVLQGTRETQGTYCTACAEHNSAALAAC